MCAIAAMSASIALLIARIAKKTTSTPELVTASAVQPAAVTQPTTNSIVCSLTLCIATYSLLVMQYSRYFASVNSFFKKFLGLLGSKPLLRDTIAFPVPTRNLTYFDRCESCDLRSVSRFLKNS